MFNEGDKISYPMHGAGIIEAIEEKSFLDEVKNYYVLRFSDGDIKVHVPVQNAEKAGLREIISCEECNKVLASFKDDADDEEESSNWNRRNRENLEKMKSGDVFEIASVIRSLLKREATKNLSSSEKKMLCTSMQILVSELAAASNKDDEEVRDIIITLIV